MKVENYYLGKHEKSYFGYTFDDIVVEDDFGFEHVAELIDVEIEVVAAAVAVAVAVAVVAEVVDVVVVVADDEVFELTGVVVDDIVVVGVDVVEVDFDHNFDVGIAVVVAGSGDVGVAFEAVYAENQILGCFVVFGCKIVVVVDVVVDYEVVVVFVVVDYEVVALTDVVGAELNFFGAVGADSVAFALLNWQNHCYYYCDFQCYGYYYCYYKNREFALQKA